METTTDEATATKAQRASAAGRGSRTSRASASVHVIEDVEFRDVVVEHGRDGRVSEQTRTHHDDAKTPDRQTPPIGRHASLRPASWHQSKGVLLAALALPLLIAVWSGTRPTPKAMQLPEPQASMSAAIPVQASFEDRLEPRLDSIAPMNSNEAQLQLVTPKPDTTDLVVPREVSPSPAEAAMASNVALSKGVSAMKETSAAPSRSSASTTRTSTDRDNVRAALEWLERRGPNPSTTAKNERR